MGLNEPSELRSSRIDRFVISGGLDCSNNIKLSGSCNSSGLDELSKVSELGELCGTNELGWWTR